jgi:hypothetical protein
MALLLIAQVAHVHPLNSGSDADHCSLCIQLQTAAPVAVIAALILLVQVGTQAPMLAPLVVILHRHPKLFTRPPPQKSC